MERLGVGRFNNSTMPISSERKIHILSLLRQRGAMTRAELSRASGIAKSSVSLIVEELLRESHVHQIRANSTNRSKSVKGRPGDYIEIDPSAGAAIGIEISFGKIVGVIGDVSHEVLASQIIQVETKPSAGKILKTCQTLVSELLAATRITPSRVLGIGLGISSSIQTSDEVKVNFSDDLWNEFNLAETLSEATGFKVQLENSANLAGYAETIWGAGKIFSNLLYFKIDKYIDGALIIDQQVIVGARGGVADFGHLILDPNGPICECGQRGCLDTYSSFQSLLNQASIASGFELNPVTFLEQVKSGNFICKQIYEDCGGRLGQGIAYLTRVLNPDAVIIGSTCLEIDSDFSRILVKNFSNFSGKNNSHIRIYNGQLGELATALGAAAKIINNPLLQIST